MTAATARVPTVLFACVHNAGRSQMAAAWMERIAGSRLRVLSAGSLPAAEIDPAARAVMAEVGIDLTGRSPQPWTEAMVRSADVVITMGCGDACPVFPGKRYEDWDLPDPQGRPLREVRAIRDDLERRVRHLAKSLGIGDD